MFHLAAYVVNTGAAAAFLDTPAIADTVLGIRNGHFILQYPMHWRLLYGAGNTLTGARIFSPTLSAYGYPQVWPFDNTAAVLPLAPDRPAVMDLGPGGIQLPLEEELAVQVSNTAAAAERDAVMAWFETPAQPTPITQGMLRLVIAAQYTVTPGAIYTWTGPQNITFQQNLRGGWWAVNHAWCEDALALGFRFIFPNPPSYMGMPLRPGQIVQPTFALRPWLIKPSDLGVWGYFNTTVPLTVEILASTVGARTGNLLLDLTYLGVNPPPGYN